MSFVAPGFNLCNSFNHELSNVLSLPASVKKVFVEHCYEVEVVFGVSILGMITVDKAVDGAFDTSRRVR